MAQLVFLERLILKILTPLNIETIIWVSLLILAFVFLIIFKKIGDQRGE